MDSGAVMGMWRSAWIPTMEGHPPTQRCLGTQTKGQPEDFWVSAGPPLWPVGREQCPCGSVTAQGLGLASVRLLPAVWKGLCVLFGPHRVVCSRHPTPKSLAALLLQVVPPHLQRESLVPGLCECPLAFLVPAVRVQGRNGLRGPSRVPQAARVGGGGDGRAVPALGQRSPRRRWLFPPPGEWYAHHPACALVLAMLVALVLALAVALAVQSGKGEAAASVRPLGSELRVPPAARPVRCQAECGPFPSGLGQALVCEAKAEGGSVVGPGPQAGCAPALSCCGGGSWGGAGTPPPTPWGRLLTPGASAPCRSLGSNWGAQGCLLPCPTELWPLWRGIL